jgi:hypothetical protein
VRRTLEDTLTDDKVTGKEDKCTIKATLDDMREQREWHQGYDQRGQFLRQLATHLKQEFKTKESALKACDDMAVAAAKEVRASNVAAGKAAMGEAVTSRDPLASITTKQFIQAMNLIYDMDIMEQLTGLLNVIGPSYDADATVDAGSVTCPSPRRLPLRSSPARRPLHGGGQPEGPQKAHTLSPAPPANPERRILYVAFIKKLWKDVSDESVSETWRHGEIYFEETGAVTKFLLVRNI